MSMLGEQIKELREKADLLDGLEGMDNLVPMLREAANTIESLKIQFIVLQDRMLKLECACVQAENEMKKLVD